MNYKLGALVLVVLSVSVYVYMAGEVRIDVAGSQTTFKVWENGWNVSGVEKNSVYNGTKSISRGTASVSYSINGNNTNITRTAKYGKSTLTDNYVFNGDLKSKELFPIGHSICVSNATGLVYQYEASKLVYSGTSRDAKSPESFGKSMKLEWDGNPYYSKLTKTTTGGKLTIKYKVKSDYECFNVRLFDPWWNSSWTKARPLIVSTQNNLTNYPLNVNITQVSCNANFTDLRLTLTDNVTVLNIWNETISGGSLNAYVKGNWNNTNGTQAYIWCGNPLASTNVSSVGVWGSEPNGFYSFSEGQGTTTLDASIFMNNGTISGATWNLTGGKHGSALYYNSTASAYVDLGNSASMNPTGNLTVTAWIMLANYNFANEQRYIVAKDAAGARSWRLNLIFGTGGYPINVITGLADDSVYAWGTTNITADTWHFVVGRYNGTHWSTFVDGVQDGATASATGPPSALATHVNIGRRANVGFEGYFNGMIDDVRIFNRSMSDSEIASMYANPEPTYSLGAEQSQTSGTITTYLNGTSNDIFKELGESVNITACSTSAETVYINTTHPSLTNPIANGTTCATYIWNQSSVVINQFNDSSTSQNHSANNISGIAINNVTDLQSGQMNIRGLPSNWCLQETANISTSCGGLSTGNYSLTTDGTWTSPMNTIDGDYSTGASRALGTPSVLVHYIKPANVLGVNWSVSVYENINRSYVIPTNCFNKNDVFLKVSQGVVASSYFCYDYDASSMISLGTITAAQFQEEAILWNIIGNGTNNVYPTNMSIDIGNDGIIDYWMPYSTLQDVYGITDRFKTNLLVKNLTFSRSGTNVTYVDLPCGAQANSLSFNVSGGTGTQTLTKVDNLNTPQYYVFSTENSSNTFRLYLPKSSTVSASPVNITLTGNPYYSSVGTLSGGSNNPTYTYPASTYLKTNSKAYDGTNIYLYAAFAGGSVICNPTFTLNLVGDSGTKATCNVPLTGCYSNWWANCYVSVTGKQPIEQVWVTASGPTTLSYNPGETGAATYFSGLNQYGTNNATNVTIWYNGSTLNYQYLPELNSSTTLQVNLSSTNMNSYLTSCTSDPCPIPFTMRTTKRGNVTISGVNVAYTNSISNITFDIANDGVTDASITGNSIPNNNVTIGAIGLNALTTYMSGTCLNRSMPIVATSETAGIMSLSNLVLNYSINPISLNVSAMTNYMASTYNTSGFCYQETANVSSGCGTLSGGFYALNPDKWLNGENAFDGSWSTSTRTNTADGNQFINITYQKPIYALNSSLWQISDNAGLVNLTIPNDCWTANTTHLKLTVHDGYSGDGDANVTWYCWNGTLKMLRTKIDAANAVKEEAIFWNMSIIINPRIGDIQIPIKYTSDNWGILNTYGLALNALTDYNYTFIGYSSATNNMTKTLKLIWSNFSVKLPETWLDYVEFVPSTNSSKNITPIGQSDSNPIFNFSYLAREQPLNISVYLNTSIDSCANITISPNENKTSGRPLNTTALYDLNLTSGTKGKWLWVDLDNCNASAARWLAPDFMFASRCSSCV